MQSLLQAIVQNDLDELKRQLQKDPAVIEDPDFNGVYPVFLAAEKGYFEMVTYLLEYSRVSMNIWDKEHHSILHYAARSNNPELFRYLVERIAMDPLEVDLQMETPLDAAIKAGAGKIQEYYRVALGIVPENLYRNPVLSGAYPDPSIVRVDDDYFMVTSSFIFFPCIPVLHSKDLIHWQTIGHAVTDPSYIDLQDLEDGRGFWAPDISFYQGRFTITATLRLNDCDNPIRKQMVVWSSRPEGPYSEPVFIDEDGIDPSLFTDSDGSRYMLLNRGGRIIPLNHEASAKTGEAKMLWYGSQKRAPEAPHLLKKDGYYYLFLSEGGTGRDHQISVARSKTLMGPYEECPFNPILKQNDPEHPLQRSGHGKLVSTPDGRWYVAYLCSRMVGQKYSILGRETALDEVQWTDDGWPMVNRLKGPSGASLKPLLERAGPPQHPQWFTGDELSLLWISPRTRDKDSFVLQPGEAKLTIVGGRQDLSGKVPTGVLLQRQTSFRFDLYVDCVLEAPGGGGEAGITCYYDRSTYLKFGLFDVGSKRTLRVIEREGDSVRIPFEKSYPVNQMVMLQLKSDYLTRSFYYKQPKEQSWQHLGTLCEVTYLSDEGGAGKRFTGSLFGLYCFCPPGGDKVKATFSGSISNEL